MNETRTEPLIDCDFPGGNIVLEKIEGDTVFLHQDLRDTTTDWFYWYFRVRNAGGRNLRFVFTKSRAIGVLGAGVSRDGGITWGWTGKDTIHGNSFSHRFESGEDDIRFSFGMPYLESNLNAMLGRLKGTQLLRREVLCKTDKGREVEILHFGCLSRPPRFKVLITCRHHCCEMMANYVLEGIVEAVVSGGDDFRQLRENVEFAAVPFVDKDGVEQGDQGKNRKPHDHNRDYGETSIYPSVRAIREKIPAWAGDKFTAAIDLHCPHIGGQYNDTIYIVGSREPEIWKRQTVFAHMLESERQGPLVYLERNNMPFGQAWNNDREFKGGYSNTGWATAAGASLPLAIEFPYALSSNQEVTQSNSKSFGYDMASALEEYLI